jgi:hypothetical protein
LDLGLKKGVTTAETLITPLLEIVRNADVPVTLRSSALTVLSTAVEVSPLALLPHLYTLADACLTLLSLESQPLKRRSEKKQQPEADGEQDTDDDDIDSVAAIRTEEELKSVRKLVGYDESAEPLSKDPKHPSFRRAAILFLGLLHRSMSAAVLDNATVYNEAHVLTEIAQRARVVLGYVASTDEDGLVRFQAGQVLDELEAEGD